MSGMDKAKAKAEELKGQVKEKVGDATDNRSMQSRGRRGSGFRQDQAGRRGRPPGWRGRHPLVLPDTSDVRVAPRT